MTIFFLCIEIQIYENLIVTINPKFLIFFTTSPIPFTIISGMEKHSYSKKEDEQNGYNEKPNYFY
jgi:hypothetical protein